MRWRSKVVAAAISLCAGQLSPASAQVSHETVKIGVLTDLSGTYSSLSGPGSVIAAQMAAEDAGGKALGRPVQIISADHQNKADIASIIARQWFDRDDVDMAIDFSNSAVALGVQQIAKEKDKITIATAVGTTDFTGKACAPSSISWLYDNYALANSVAKAVVRRGLKSWYFVTVDFSFGHSLEEEASKSVKQAGGTILGASRHPQDAADYSSFLLSAQQSGSQVIGFANSGGQLTNSIKQANEFGVQQGGQTLVAFVTFLTDIHSLGLEITKDLNFVTAFYWDRNDETRAWSKRFYERHGAMPTMSHAGVYSAVRHYLKAVEAAGTDDTKAVMAKMRDIPVNDFFASDGHIRADGRLVHDMYLVRVKRPEQSRYPWDYYEVLDTIAGEDAFRPVSESGCPLAKGQ